MIQLRGKAEDPIMPPWLQHWCRAKLYLILVEPNVSALLGSDRSQKIVDYVTLKWSQTKADDFGAQIHS